MSFDQINVDLDYIVDWLVVAFFVFFVWLVCWFVELLCLFVLFCLAFPKRVQEIKQVGSGEVIISKQEFYTGLCAGHQCPCMATGPDAQTCPTAVSWLGELDGVRTGSSGIMLVCSMSLHPFLPLSWVHKMLTFLQTLTKKAKENISLLYSMLLNAWLGMPCS